MQAFDTEERVTQAVDRFLSGYNCAQSLFLAYADLFGLDEALARDLSVSFGGGLGRMREVCGTVSAMAMLAGLRYPVADPKDQASRTRNYQMVQRLAGQFKEQFGTICCRDLLKQKAPASTDPAPALRTAEYYAKRPCARYVEAAARLTAAMLRETLEAAPAD